MVLKRLDSRVLKLWYIRAAILSLALIGVFGSAVIILGVAEASATVTLAVLIGIGIPDLLLLALTLILPALRFKMYAWGYDEKRITVRQGVIFRHNVVIPICQIQDLHRTEGPIMMMLGLSDVTISTAGSNFDISTLTREEAEKLVCELEKKLEARIEELKNEEI